jgi:hypothetical protein
MKSFLLKNNQPIVKWSQISEGRFFEGPVPEGYDLAISPSAPYIILDVDNKEGKNGFTHIPANIQKELDTHFSYPTKKNGRHYWLNYSGDYNLKNRATKLGLDLRTDKGYVKWHFKGDIRDYISQVMPTSQTLNEWLITLFK